MAATNLQVQNFADGRVRPFCEAVRAVYLTAKDAKSAIDDVYENLTKSPTWTDNRTDGPAHLLTPNDVLAYNTFINDLITMIEGNAQWPIIQKSCARGV